MKRLVLCFVLVLAVAFMFSGKQAEAAKTQNIWIKVSISATNSIVIANGATNWNVMGVPFDFIALRGTNSVVSNDGLITETLGLQLDTLGSGWTNSTDLANGLNEYVLQGIFMTNGSVQPASGTFSVDTGTDDIITVTATDSDNTTFTFGTSAVNNGVGLNPGDRRDLWLKLQVPSSGTPTPGQPTIRCIVTSTQL